MKKFRKYLFWLILGALSTYFAEVVTASTPFPFFTLPGLLVTYPFYTLNMLVFAYVAFQKRKVDLYTLFLAGQVFGLFEAYGTKMLWSPGWGAEPKFLGISVIPFLLLIFLWHPLMSFALPILIAESYLISSNEVVTGIPGWISRYLGNKRILYVIFVLFVLFCAINQAVNSPSKMVSLLSPSASWIPILLSIWLWRRKGLNFSLRELLPTKREISVVFPFFLLMYALLGIYLFPEGIPQLEEQAGVWVLYAFFGALLYFDVKSPHSEVANVPQEVPREIFASFGFVVAFVAYLLPKSVPLVVVSWVPGVAVGISIFCCAVRRIFKIFPNPHEEGLK
ncbi:hypothetical protein [Thermococcus alcaliphilus]|uniref:hypothetical protein n=1 Tax=Thermococcus alcaliphilus TaxID=139207 RepID=UPI0020912BA2|nr:hypothetical protein [Thermococcus alcaliphilus]MCO6041394.1 hypothetical protein [Thermococcus alcaliphilus]